MPRSDLQVHESLPVPLLLVRGDQVLHANEPFVRLLGVDAGALEGASTRALLERFCPPDERPLLERIDEARSRGGSTPPLVWTRLRSADGSEREVGVQVVEAPGGRGEHLCLVIDAGADRIGRRLTEALAQAASGFLRCRDEASVLKAARSILMQCGLRATFFLREADGLRLDSVFLEPEECSVVERAAGCAPEQVRLAPADAPLLHQVLESGRPIFVQDAQLSIRRTESALAGALISSDRVCVVRIGVEEGPLGVLALQGEALSPAAAATIDLFASHVGAALENVRHHRRAAERLEEITRLQRTVVERERAAAVGDAAAVLAHEVRNPLGAIFNAVALLKRGNGRIPTAELLAMIQEEAERIDVLIGDLLDLARPLEPALRQLELEPLVARAIELVRGRDVPATIELARDGGGGEVRGDPHLVQMAVENLVRNAAQSTPPGGRVRVRVGGDEACGAVFVEDEGEGTEEPDRVFEPFHPAQRGGAGLALAVVKRVAALHGGSVEVRRREAAGSIFELRFPRR